MDLVSRGERSLDFLDLPSLLLNRMDFLLALFLVRTISNSYSSWFFDDPLDFGVCNCSSILGGLVGSLLSKVSLGNLLLPGQDHDADLLGIGGQLVLGYPPRQDTAILGGFLAADYALGFMAIVLGGLVPLANILENNLFHLMAVLLLLVPASLLGLVGASPTVLHNTYRLR